MSSLAVTYDETPLAADQYLAAFPPRTGAEGAPTIGLLRPDGERRWVRAKTHALRTPEGDVEHGVVVLVDVTEEREAAERLRKSEVHCRRIVENS